MLDFAENNICEVSIWVDKASRDDVLLAATESTPLQFKSVAKGGIGFYLVRVWLQAEEAAQKSAMPAAKKARRSTGGASASSSSRAEPGPSELS